MTNVLRLTLDYFWMNVRGHPMGSIAHEQPTGNPRAVDGHPAGILRALGG